MNPFEFPKDFFEFAPETFQIERNNSIIAQAIGDFCDHRYPDSIQLFEDVDIKIGDWLINQSTKARYYVKDLHPLTMKGAPTEWMVKYQTEADYNRSILVSPSTTIHIQSVSGNSVIGSQEHVTFNIGYNLSDVEKIIKTFSSDEQSEAEELVQYLKDTASSTHPVLVEGALSKFSNLLKKHTDLLTAVGGWAVQLLIGSK